MPEWIEVTWQTLVPPPGVRSLLSLEPKLMTFSAWHTRECLDGDAANKKARIEWTSSWPYYCRHCDGVGGHCYEYDPSPPGVALSPGYMVDCDPCTRCVEHGVCSRCGEKLAADDEALERAYDEMIPCMHCGWNWGQDPLDILPPRWECYCWARRDNPEREHERH